MFGVNVSVEYFNIIFFSLGSPIMFINQVERTVEHRVVLGGAWWCLAVLGGAWWCLAVLGGA